MMKRLLGVLALAGAALGATITQAPAAPVTVDEPPGVVIPGLEVLDDVDESEQPEGVHALLNGVHINLLEGWGSATVCAVVSPSDVRCYDTPLQMATDLGETLDAKGTAADACPRGWGCIWEHVNYNANASGRMLQFRDVGPRQGLGQYGFRDKASSVRNRLPAGTNLKLINFHTGWYDQSYSWASGEREPNFTRLPEYQDGGNFNDKADAITLSRA